MRRYVEVCSGARGIDDSAALLAAPLARRRVGRGAGGHAAFGLALLALPGRRVARHRRRGGAGLEPDDPEAEHLRENVRAELFGTTDVREAIEGGIPWNPPDGPTPEGTSGVDELDEPPEAANDDR